MFLFWGVHHDSLLVLDTSSNIINQLLAEGSALAPLVITSKAIETAPHIPQKPHFTVSHCFRMFPHLPGGLHGGYFAFPLVKPWQPSGPVQGTEPGQRHIELRRIKDLGEVQLPGV